MWTEKHRGEFQRRRLCGKSPDECGSQEGGLGVKTTLPSAQEVQAWLGGTQSRYNSLPALAYGKPTK